MRHIASDRLRAVALRVSLVVSAALTCACGGSTTGGTTSGISSAGGSGQGGAGGVRAVRKCILNSDCTNGLVCAFGLCNAECATTKDCPAPQRCLPTASDDAGVALACVAPTVSACRYNTDCNAPLVCAVDLQCRSQCAGDRDCLSGQRCVFGVCSDPSEINPNGTLKGATDAGGLPGSGAGGTRP